MKRSAVLFALVAAMLTLAAPAMFGQTQLELNMQAQKEAEKSDAALNAAYKELLGLLDAEATEKLRVSQRAWVKFRDGECAFEADLYRGGSMAPMIYSSCFKSLTDARTLQLKVTIKEMKAR